jgi:hypothetical protein
LNSSGAQQPDVSFQLVFKRFLREKVSIAETVSLRVVHLKSKDNDSANVKYHQQAFFKCDIGFEDSGNRSELQRGLNHEITKNTFYGFQTKLTVNINIRFSALVTNKRHDDIFACKVKVP